MELQRYLSPNSLALALSDATTGLAADLSTAHGDLASKRRFCPCADVHAKD